MKLLFMDIVDHVDAENLMEGALIARTLKFKRDWDFLNEAGTRFQAPIVTENEYGSRVNHRTVIGRARRLNISTYPLFDEKAFVEALTLTIPHILFVGAHGWNNPSRWLTHRGTSIRLGRLYKRIEDAQIRLNRTCLVTNACKMGTVTVLKDLKRIGFGSVIAWPNNTCLTETLSFHIDFFEAVMFQYFYNRNRVFWSWRKARPPMALVKAFSFARDNLAERNKCLNRHFPSRNKRLSEGERSNMAGYYLHSKGWRGTNKNGYAEYPVMYPVVP